MGWWIIAILTSRRYKKMLGPNRVLIKSCIIRTGAVGDCTVLYTVGNAVWYMWIGKVGYKGGVHGPLPLLQISSLCNWIILHPKCICSRAQVLNFVILLTPVWMLHYWLFNLANWKYNLIYSVFIIIFCTENSYKESYLYINCSLIFCTICVFIWCLLNSGM